MADAQGFNTYTYAITVNAVNDVPTSANGSNSVDEDQILSAMLLGAIDIDGDPVSYALDGQAANGVAAVNPDGSFTYTPGANFNGSDGFGFTVADAQGSNTYAYAVAVNAVNDVPTSANGSNSVDEDQILSAMLPGAIDIDGDPVSYALGSQAANGVAAVNPDGSFTYTPGANFNGSDGFSFTVADVPGSNTYAYAITVNAVNDVPTSANGSNSVHEDQILSAMLPGAIDIDGDPVSYALGSQAANGIAAVNPDGSFTYTPGANFNGSDSFGFTVADAQGSNTYAYAVTVNAVNDDPTSANGSNNVDEDQIVGDVAGGNRHRRRLGELCARQPSRQRHRCGQPRRQLHLYAGCKLQWLRQLRLHGGGRPGLQHLYICGHH